MGNTGPDQGPNFADILARKEAAQQNLDALDGEKTAEDQKDGEEGLMIIKDGEEYTDIFIGEVKTVLNFFKAAEYDVDDMDNEYQYLEDMVKLLEDAVQDGLPELERHSRTLHRHLEPILARIRAAEAAAGGQGEGGQAPEGTPGGDAGLAGGPGEQTPGTPEELGPPPADAPEKPTLGSTIIELKRADKPADIIRDVFGVDWETDPNKAFILISRLTTLRGPDANPDGIKKGGEKVDVQPIIDAWDRIDWTADGLGWYLEHSTDDRKDYWVTSLRETSAEKEETIVTGVDPTTAERQPQPGTEPGPGAGPGPGVEIRGTAEFSDNTAIDHVYTETEAGSMGLIAAIDPAPADETARKFEITNPDYEWADSQNNADNSIKRVSTDHEKSQITVGTEVKADRANRLGLIVLEADAGEKGPYTRENYEITDSSYTWKEETEDLILVKRETATYEGGEAQRLGLITPTPTEGAPFPQDHIYTQTDFARKEGYEWVDPDNPSNLQVRGPEVPPLLDVVAPNNPRYGEIVGDNGLIRTSQQEEWEWADPTDPENGSVKRKSAPQEAKGGALDGIGEELAEDGSMSLKEAWREGLVEFVGTDRGSQDKTHWKRTNPDRYEWVEGETLRLREIEGPPEGVREFRVGKHTITIDYSLLDEETARLMETAGGTFVASVGKTVHDHLHRVQHSAQTNDGIDNVDKGHRHDPFIGYDTGLVKFQDAYDSDDETITLTQIPTGMTAQQVAEILNLVSNQTVASIERGQQEEPAELPKGTIFDLYIQEQSGSIQLTESDFDVNSDILPILRDLTPSQKGRFAAFLKTTLENQHPSNETPKWGKEQAPFNASSTKITFLEGWAETDDVVLDDDTLERMGLPESMDLERIGTILNALYIKLYTP